MPASPRLSRALALLEPLDLPRGTKTPPLHRLLWRAGVEVPPPLLARPAFNVVTLGLFFAVAWGALMALVTAFALPGALTRLPWLLPSAALSAGVLFGGVMGAYFRGLSRRYRLPTWASLA